MTGRFRSKSLSAPIGYRPGTAQAAAVTQATNRTTAVTSNGLCGKITTNNASLAAEGTADFVVNNNMVEIGDVVVLNMRSGSNGGGTIATVSAKAAGSFTVRIHNGNVAAGTAETGAIILDYAVIKTGIDV